MTRPSIAPMIYSFADADKALHIMVTEIQYDPEDNKAKGQPIQYGCYAMPKRNWQYSEAGGDLLFELCTLIIQMVQNRNYARFQRRINQLCDRILWDEADYHFFCINYELRRIYRMPGNGVDGDIYSFTA